MTAIRCAAIETPFRESIHDDPLTGSDYRRGDRAATRDDACGCAMMRATLVPAREFRR